MEYYAATPGITVKDISVRWVTNGDKIYDHSMPLQMNIEDIWKYREYDRNRNFSKAGHPFPYYSDEGKELKNYPGEEKWDLMIQSMQKYGWDKREPMHLMVGKDGKARVGEGNHRLAIARQLGIKTVPVFVHFHQKIYDSEMGRLPKMVEMNFKTYYNST